MINTKDIYEVFAALVPLYVALLLGSGSVQFWKIFTPEQCSGINRFVAVFAVPLLSFHFISSNDPYTMNFRFIAADSLQKVVILSILFLWQAIDKRRGGNGSFEWMITLFSLSTLPNTLVMGIPLMNAMYGDFTETLMIQIVVLQSVIWYTVMIFMFEYRAAKVLISKQFPETAEAISSFRVDSNIFSLSDCEPLQVSSEIDNDGKLHVLLRRSSSSVSSTSVLSLFNKSHGVNSITSLSPRASNLSGVEILSAQSASRTSNKELHMFVWSPSPCSTSDGDHLENTVNTNNNGFADSTEDFEVTDDKVAPQLETTVSRVMERKGTKKHQMPPAGVTSRLILVMVWRKLIRNPNTYASVLGLVWSLISFRWNVKMPSIVKGSIEIVSGAGLGMTMFSLGLFMGMQPKIIACGKCLAMVGMAVRFLIGPAVVAATSVAIGIRGNLLHVAIIQAALPQAIVPFVFAKEYNVHADILSTVVLFGMIIALPVAIIYYVLLGL